MSYQTSSMETILQSPSIESFSCSWIPNSNPSASIFDDSSMSSSFDAIDHHHDHHDDTSYIEMDPRLPPSKRFFRVSSDHYCFEFPLSDIDHINQSPLGLVHADQLISNGFLLPLFIEDVDNVKMHHRDIDCQLDDYNMSTNCSLTRGKVDHLSTRVRRVLWKRFFEKYLKFLLRPWFCGIRESCSRRKWEFSAGTSPRTSVAYSIDSESSIHEAVLHCKRTQGN